MGKQRNINPSRLFRSLFVGAASLLFPFGSAVAQPPTQATTVPLLLPGGLAYDTQGNLYFAETASHLIRRVSPTGVLTVVAGTGVQGFAGDGGAAISALLDSPTAVAVDAAGDLYLADTHNHRIRRVDAVSGTITTVAAPPQVSLPTALAVDSAGNLCFADAASHIIGRISATGAVTTIAGNGIQGYSGDGGLAVAASIDSPTALAFDAAGDLYFSDTHNHRIRRVDAVTGIITSVAGNGQPGFSGDGATAVAARIDLPRGLTLDSSGNLFLVDSQNQRIRRIDAITGQISTVAGDGTQAFSGDGGSAAAAALNNPRAIALSPANLPTLSDTANARIRQIDTAADIHTIAGLGASGATTLTLSGASVLLYGTGSVTATLHASPATGNVTFFDAPGAVSLPVTIATIPLTSNSAVDSTATLAAGVHHLSATYSGDVTHAAAQSGTLAITVSPVSAIATPTPASVFYGLPIPALTGSLTGVLAQDASSVSAVFTSAAASLSAAGTYPISASLSGAAAGNYSLTTSPAVLTINKAPATLTLPTGLTAHIASTTSGVPTGNVNLLDGAALYATAALNLNGDAAFSSANMTNGTHTLTAVYLGDTNFLATTSAPITVTIGAVGTSDFSFAATSSTSVTIPAGNTATFTFATTPINGALTSPILLTTSGLPVGATATFNPAYIPPTGSPVAFTLTIQTAKAAARIPGRSATWLFAALIPLALLRKRRRVLMLGCATVFSLGCGARVNENSVVTPARTYNITVLATATSTTGGTLQHTAAVTLTLQ